MIAALTAATTAIDALQALTSKLAASKTTKTGLQNTSTPFDLGSSSATKKSEADDKSTSSTSSTQGMLSPATMSTLLAAQGVAGGTTSPTPSDSSGSSRLKDLFKLLDGDGDGKISMQEFEDKLGAGGTNTANADKVLGKLDKDGDGSVDLDELSAVVKGRNAIASYNETEQLIARRSQASQVSAASTLSVSA